MPELVVGWCSHEAARYAVNHWHYSKSLPASKVVKVGVWEDDRFIGVVLFSRGASPFLGTAYGLDQTELCELTRVALDVHVAPVSRIVTEAIRLLKEQSPNLRLIVSFADPQHGHHGGIYQAMNWLYTGLSNPVTENFIRGRWHHVRNSHHLIPPGGCPTRTRPGKHRYLLPLDRQMRRRLVRLAKPYPANVDDAVEGSEGAATVPRSKVGFDSRTPLEEGS